ncbi:MAG TPA: adenylosuccinate synthetase [Longimicrobium sp.]|jgi:adenylosuccinate synthase|uniref:adenylosuccinate synthetase n=1 Tax=Longimicrobium sp. TaxID=2029185 RepID=UPI002ED9D0A1
MKHARVVIGSSFGDEGKGLMTDYFTRQYGGSGVLVVRFNGGAQAGHTVVAEGDVRHVFSHFGAGSLAGAGTLLSRHFIANPILFQREHGELARLGVDPRIHVDPRALVTTPYDMLINEMVEASRGAARHGSVGLGINETVTRGAEPRLRLTVGQALRDPAAAAAMLRRIRDAWVPRRVAQLGIEAACETHAELIGSGALMENWLAVLDEFLGRVEVRPDHDVLREHDDVVFEGAQGLALDQDRGTFPHVTRSHTGVRNVVELMSELPPAETAVTYATRAYLTRHGAGPLDGELADKPFPGVYDLTNVPHAFQGRLRYALLDVTALQARITQDFGDVAALGRTAGIRMGVAVTCLDQLPAAARWTCEGEAMDGSPDDLVHAIRRHLPGELLVSRGPRAGDVAAACGA